MMVDLIFFNSFKAYLHCKGINKSLMEMFLWYTRSCQRNGFSSVNRENPFVNTATLLILVKYTLPTWCFKRDWLVQQDLDYILEERPKNKTFDWHLFTRSDTLHFFLFKCGACGKDANNSEDFIQRVYLSYMFTCTCLQCLWSHRNWSYVNTTLRSSTLCASSRLAFIFRV